MRLDFESLPRVLRSSLRDADGLPLLFAWLLAGFASLYLIWHCVYPPFIDAANVAYSGEVMHDLWRGGSIYGKWYSFRSGAVSHLVFYRAYHCLRYVFAPVTCIKVLSSVGVLTLPAAMYGLLRSMKLSAWLGIPAFALAFNTNLNMGYLPFVIGIPLIPLALTLVERNAEDSRLWRWALLFVIVLVSPWVHLFLSAILIPIVILWSILSLTGRRRLWFLGAVMGMTALLLIVLLPRGPIPRFRDVFQFVPYAEHWDLFDRDVIQWTLDGAAALSFPWLLLAFASSLVLTRGSPSTERGLRALRAPILALALFLVYLLGPTYISWPEPAWGFGTRVGIALALVLPLVASTSAVGWLRFAQYSPWVAFGFWHLGALVGPFDAYDTATRPMAQLLSSVPKHSKVLPLYGTEWMKDPAHFSFGGFTGFAFRHVGKWLAVETQSYQPWSFCDAGYHPIRCTLHLAASRDQKISGINPVMLGNYDFVLVQDNESEVQRQLASLPLALVRRVGQWSLWRPQIAASTSMSPGSNPFGIERQH